MIQNQKDKNGYQFNLAIFPKIKDIFDPIRQIFPITNLAYSRLYNDNKIVHIQSELNLLEALLKNNFTSQGLKNENLRQAVRRTTNESQHLWPSNSNDDLSRFLYEFNWKNMMTIIRKKDSYIEALTFSNSLEEKKSMDLYFKNSDIYKHFYYYFLNKINDFVDFNDKDIFFDSTLYDYYNENPEIHIP